MKHKKLFFALAGTAMLLGLVAPRVFVEPEFIGEDNAEYSNNLVADYSKPDFEYKANPKKAASATTSFVLNYHNDDAKCDKREVWVWSDGVNGSAFAPVVSTDKKDMVLTIAFTGANAAFAGKKSISFIIKDKGTWVGQSENVQILYADYEPDESGKTEVWTIPGEGNAIEVYRTKAETEMSRFQLATFVDWKTIEVIASDVPKTYKLYALTSSFMQYGKREQAIRLPNYLIAEGENPTCTNVTYNSVACKKFQIKLNYTAKVNVQYYIEGVFPNYEEYTKTKYVSFHQLYGTERFEKYYTYTGDDLGCTYNAEDKSTTFKVWAPTAARVRVLIYDYGTSADIGEEYNVEEATDDARGFTMAFTKGGVWQLTIKNQDLKNKYYNYYVVNSLGEQEATDPYAKACGVNGDRGMIVDWSETNPEGWDSVPKKWDGDTTGYDIATPQDLSIYETHIRDLTMDASWTGTAAKKGTYAGFIEGGTKLSDGTTPTGFDHLTRLGVKAIQLEPVFDHDNNEEPGNRVQNWGYNPKNYNCVEGSYAIDPYDGVARIKEFKQMVQAFATNGNHTRIIMDVVYNHVSSAPGSCFNKLMPKYYFRYASDGTYFDGSGCGNEVRTEAPMMRKYIVDSLCWWASEYKIKGFRFDLMGLIDVGTIDDARKALYSVDPDIYLYGEGWTGDGSGYDYGTGEAYQVHGNQDLHDDGTEAHNNLTKEQIKLLGCVRTSVYRYLYPTEGACLVGSFNDSGRNALRGDNHAGDKGFLSGDFSDNKSQKVADMMAGYSTNYGGNPVQCVNYASCHDNFTLFDQFGLVPATTDTGMDCAATIAAECAIMFSNGVAFIHGGEEVFRSKVIAPGSDDDKLATAYAMKGSEKISENSYNLSDAVNAYKWDRLKAIGNFITTGYVEALVNAIHLRNSLTRYSQADLAAEHPYQEGSKFNIWTNGGRGEGGWPIWSSATAIGVWNNGYGATCLLTGLTNDAVIYVPGGNPQASGVNIAVNSNPLGNISYSEGNVGLGGAVCIAYK